LAAKRAFLMSQLIQPEVSYQTKQTTGRAIKLR
jgi:hypothetical protein